MSEARPVLESPESFAAYRERVKVQMKAQVEERIVFLDSAIRELSMLEALARKASNISLVAELSSVAQAARHEMAALRGFDPVSQASMDDQPIRLDSLSEFAVAPRTSLTDYRSVAARPVAPVKPTPVIPQVPETPRRPTEEIVKDVEALSDRIENGPPFPGIPGLLKLKSLMCRQRALQSELAAQDVQHWPVQQLIGQIRRRIEDEHGPDHYLIPLRREIWPNDAWPWAKASEYYDWLSQAYEALAWFDLEVDNLPRQDRHELLECIAAHQTRLYRHLQAYFPRQNDEHQIALFRDLCAIADEEDVYLQCLQERFPDDLLSERGESLPAVLERLNADRATREKRVEAVNAVRELISREDFGSTEDDRKALVKAVSKARKEGEAASSLALRDLVGRHTEMLSHTTDKLVLETLRELEKDAERAAARVDEDGGDLERQLTPSEAAELEAVREMVRGRKCLFIGGVCREESRQKLEKELGLSELVWPTTNGTESVYKFEPDIENTDVTVVLVRFMRTGWGQARDLATRHGKLFVRLPAGYGLKQVVRQFSIQLGAQKEAIVAAAR